MLMHWNIGRLPKEASLLQLTSTKLILGKNKSTILCLSLVGIFQFPVLGFIKSRTTVLLKLYCNSVVMTW